MIMKIKTKDTSANFTKCKFTEIRNGKEIW